MGGDGPARHNRFGSGVLKAQEPMSGTVFTKAIKALLQPAVPGALALALIGAPSLAAEPQPAEPERPPAAAREEAPAEPSGASERKQEGEPSGSFQVFDPSMDIEAGQAVPFPADI